MRSYAKRISECISIHAAREGGDDVIIEPVEIVDISIHAAREGGDFSPLRYFINFCISIHAAREGGDVIFFV